MKKMILLLGLILGICNMGVTAFAEEGQVEVQVNTQKTDGSRYEGTEALVLDIYDLTEWRVKRASDEKTDKEYILNKYPTKEKLASFVQNEQLKKVNQTAIPVDEAGRVALNLPRYQAERDAAYLILASGETKNYQMLPVIIYLPQIDIETKEEVSEWVIYCKYGEISPTPIEPPTIDSSEPPITIPSDSWQGTKTYPDKVLPATNTLIQNYCLLGGSLLAIGFIGLFKKQGGKE
ncbi:MAG: hypothetical protein RSC16_07835 [Enterococcus sp.]|uniref:hypothetical protein n=1 Tax=Enterococcus TaxID=1350 RepID=UPI002FCA3C0B